MFYEMLTSLAMSLKLQRRLVVIIKHVECGLYHDKHQKTHQLFVVLDIGQTVTQLGTQGVPISQNSSLLASSVWISRCIRSSFSLSHMCIAHT
jgi:hypothetical protein